jgi:exosortase
MPSLKLLASVVFFAALWLILWWQLSGEWSVNDQYSYGWFIPFLAIVLFWLRWEDRPKADHSGHRSAISGQRSNNQERITNNRKAQAIAIGIVIFALSLLFPIRLFEIGNPDWRPLSWLHAICVVAITLVFLWAVGGKPWLRHFAFPVGFTLIAVPWISPIEQPVVQDLMRIVAAISSEVVALFGIPAQLEGHLIRIPGGLIGVNEACSGVRSLQTSLMIGLLFGELKRLSILRRAILVVAAAAIAFLGNCVRAFFLVWVAANQNTAAANRWHDFAGYGIVALVFLGTLILTSLFGSGKKQRATIKVESRKDEVENEGKTEGHRSGFLISNFYYLLSAAAIIWLGITEFAAAEWYRAHEGDLAQTMRWQVQWPKAAPNFHEMKIEDDVRRILRFDEGHAATWNLPATDSGSAAANKPLTCTLYFFRWNSGKNSALLANLHRPDVCLPSIGWNQTGDTGVKKYSVAQDLVLPFRHFEFRHESPGQSTQQTAHAFYCLWEDRVSLAATKSQLPEMSISASAWTRNERIRAVLEGRRHLGQQVLELIVQGRGEPDEDAVNEKFAELIPTLIKLSGQ